MSINNQIDHLFRHESGKMISVIARIVGYGNVDLAEDIVQDTLLKAMQIWGQKGLPENPTAWLYSVAKNKAIDEIRKSKNKEKYQSEVSNLLYSEWSLIPTIDKMFLDSEIQDSQLRMIFACCHPSISIEYQISIILKILAGFSAKEIAKALMTNEETVNKRIYRAKKKLAESNLDLDKSIKTDFDKRIATVNRVIYLIFNEGYSATTGERILRNDLCFEALRLVELITNSEESNNDYSVGLKALIKFHLARNNARFDKNNNLVTLDLQERKLWDFGLITSGLSDLKTIKIKNTNKYYLEAVISANHSIAKTFEETNWEAIISIYYYLYQLEKSPFILLNQYIAISYNSSIDEAINLILKLEVLADNYLYHSTLSQLYKRKGSIKKAIEHLKSAIELTENKQEIEHLTKKLKKLLE